VGKAAVAIDLTDGERRELEKLGRAAEDGAGVGATGSHPFFWLRKAYASGNDRLPRWRRSNGLWPRATSRERRCRG